MIPLPDDINSDDIEQWLARGWFLADVGEQLQPCQLVGLEFTDQLIVCTLGGVTARVPRSKAWAHWPTCNAINITDTYAGYLKREQSRQWRRTYNARILSLHIPNRYECIKRHGHTVRGLGPDSTDVVRAAFNPEYVSTGVALAGMRKGHVISAAVSPQVILSMNPNFDGCNVLYRNEVVGRIDYNHRSGDKYILLGTDPSSPVAPRIVKYLGGEVIVDAST